MGLGMGLGWDGIGIHILTFNGVGMGLRLKILWFLFSKTHSLSIVKNESKIELIRKPPKNMLFAHLSGIALHILFFE
jgi:hypothetical protein